MDDCFDDFDSDYNEGEFMDDDPIEEPLNCDFESNDLFNQDNQKETNLLEDDNDNGKFDIEDSFILGGAMGLAYEAGLNEIERIRLLKIQQKEAPERKKQRDDTN